MDDRRATPRHKVDLGGKLLFPDASRIVDCRVVDMTEDGARIKFAAGLDVPDRAYLWELKTNMVFECNVRWRKAGSIGVSFQTCNRVMRQAIVEACTLGPLDQTQPTADGGTRRSAKQRALQ